MASIKDVAKYAGVAPSTVSLVLNNAGYVSQRTREKVESAVRELNYTPNELARNLYRNRTNMVGIIVPDTAHPFFSTFIRYAEIYLYRFGYKTMVCSTIHRENGEAEYIDMLKRQMMDGVIMGAHSLDLDIYVHVERPIVALDRFINEQIPIVRSDHVQEGRFAAECLLQKGCRKVVQVSGARIVSTPSHNRHDVFRRYFEADGGTVYDLEMDWNHFDLDYSMKFAEHIFKTYSDIDGIFAADMQVAACLRYAREHQIQVPEQMKMVACDGTYLTLLNERPITAIVQPIEALAQEAARQVLELIEGKSILNKECVFGVTLWEGATT